MHTTEISIVTDICTHSIETQAFITRFVPKKRGFAWKCIPLLKQCVVNAEAAETQRTQSF